MQDKVEFGAMTVDQLCKRVQMSRSFFYDLLKQGRGPKVTRIGTKVLITNEAASKWLAGFEDKSNAA